MTDTGKNPGIDKKLVALLTGELGDTQKIGRVCADLGQVLAGSLPDMIESETGLKMAFAYAGCSVGFKNDLIADLDEYMVLVDGGLQNWTHDFTIACASPIIIAMVESLLGGAAESIIESGARPVSKIELQMCPMLTDKIAWVLQNAVDAPGGYEAILTKPYNAEDRPPGDDDQKDIFAAELKLTAVYGPVTSTFSLLMPQRALLKTRVKSPRPQSPAAQASTGWTEQLADQVRRSDIRLEARIRLQPLTLGKVSRLQPGDIIPFLDTSDVSVEVNANGHDIYICEFGRSGEQYTVRVKDTHGSEGELLRHLMG